MKTKGRLLSFFLAVLMVASVLTVFQPLVAEAAAPSGSITIPKVGFIGEKFVIEGTVRSNGSPIDIVNIAIYKDSTKSVGVWCFRKEGLNASSFNFSTKAKLFEWGDKVESVKPDSLNDPFDTGAYSSVFVEVIVKAKDGTSTIKTETIQIMDVSKSNLDFSAAGGDETFTITASSSWTVTDNKTWINVTPSSGSSSKTITVSCSKNTSTNSREGTVTVKHSSTGETYTIDVYQEGDVVPPEVELTISDSEITLGDTITYEGIAIGNSFTLNTVTVGISYFTNESNFQNEIGESVYFRHTGLSASSYEVGDTIKTGANQSITGTDNTSTNSVTMRMDRAGIYSITLHGYSSKYGKDVKVVKKFVVVEEEIEDPEILSVTLSSSSVQVGKAFSITVITNSSAKGAAFFVDSEDTSIGTTVTAFDTNTYVHTYVFNKTGKEDPATNADISNSRVIYVYPIDENGNVLTEADFEYVRITVNPAQYTFDDFSVHAAQTRIDQAVTIEWEAAVSKNGATVYYNLWIADEKIAEELKQTSYTLSADQVKKIGAGSIGVMVMATAEGHRQKQAVGSLTIYPRGAVLPGDVNGDSEINADDVTQLRKYLANTDSTAVPRSATQGADVNEDGQINGKDLTALLVKMENGNIPMPKPEPEPDIPVEPSTPNDRDPNAEYTFWMPLQLATLPAVSQLEILDNLHDIYLLPMYGYAAIQGYDITNQKKVSLKTAGIVFDETSNTGNVTVDQYGTICARKVGYGWLGYKQEINGQWVEKAIFIHVGNRSSNENVPSPYLYNEIDYQYISMALDLNFTAYRASMPTQYADVDMSMGSIVIDSVANVGQYMQWIFQGKGGNIQSALLQQSLSKFITEYSEEICGAEDSDIVAHNNALTEFVMFTFDTLFDSAYDIESTANDIREILGFESWKAVKASYDAVKGNGGNAKDIKNLFEFFHKMMYHNDINKVITQSLNFTNKLKELGLSWSSIKYLAKDMLYFCSDEVVNKFTKAFKKGTNYLGLALDGFEFFVYVSSDFSNNIRVLTKLKEQLLAYYNKDCVEIQAIDSLIWQYQNQILEGAIVWISKAGTGAVMTLSHPIVAITTFAFSVIGTAYKVEEKRDITIMVLYVCALNKTMFACDEMYLRGKHLISLDDMRFNAAMYFNMILRQSELALKVANEEEKIKIEEEIAEINTLFKEYISYTMPKSSN